jgi:hypothetical protein
VEHHPDKIIYRSPVHNNNTSSMGVNKVLVNSRGGPEAKQMRESHQQRDLVQRNYASNNFEAYNSPYSSRTSTLDHYNSRESTLNTRSTRPYYNSQPGSRESTLDRDVQRGNNSNKFGHKGPFVLDSSTLRSDLDDWSDHSSHSESEFQRDRESLGDSEIESILGMTGRSSNRKRRKEGFYFNSLDRNDLSIASGSVDRRNPRIHEGRYQNTPNGTTNPSFEMSNANSRVVDANFELRRSNVDDVHVVDSGDTRDRYDWEKAEKTLSIMEYLMTKDQSNSPSHEAHNSSLRPDEEVSVFL